MGRYDGMIELQIQTSRVQLFPILQYSGRTFQPMKAILQQNTLHAGQFLFPEYFSPHDVIEFSQRMDIQAIHWSNNIVLNDTYMPFYMILVLRYLHSSWFRNCPIMLKKLHIPCIQDAFLIEMAPIHSSCTVIR